MKITLRKSTSESSLSSMAAIALSARLYVPGWSLSGDLVNLKEFGSLYAESMSIALAYLGDVPIGICVTEKYFDDDPLVRVSIFVRKQYRNQGIGSKLLRKILGRNSEFNHSSGIQGSDIFYAKFKERS